MYQRKHKPKGQQPVDVKKLKKRKMEYAKHISHPDWQLENIRKRRFKDIIFWNGRNPSLTGFDGFYGWLWWFCGDKRSGRGDWYHREAVQPMRDMVKMIPQFHIDYDCMKFDNVDDETLVLIKHSSKRKDYRDAEQWKGMVDFIRNHNTKKLIKKIFFCTYVNCSYRETPKIRDKEWKFIEDAGCKCVGDMSSHIWINDKYRKSETTHWELKGKLFTINN
jgi:hypothetical protein